MSAVPGIILFGKPPVEPREKDISSSVVSGDPRQNVWLYCDNAAAGARFGVWDCQPGTHRATMENIVEFCYIIEGEAVIRNLDSGEEHTVVAGDAFVMEPGLCTEWSVANYVKKYFVISDASV